MARQTNISTADPADPPPPAADPLDAEIAGLRNLSLEDLRRRWRQETSKQAPDHLPKFLLLHMLAYRLQADIFGDLDRESRDLLDEIADAVAQEKVGGMEAGTGANIIVPRVKSRRLKPGTVLVREHEGTLHRVTILEKEFGWNGMVHDSLSAIAKSITGTAWNGPRFFGLRQKPPAPANAPIATKARRAS